MALMTVSGLQGKIGTEKEKRLEDFCRVPRSGMKAGSRTGMQGK
jgi:hypothetical protein